MCLQSADKETEDFRAKKAGQTITVWKVYDIRDNKMLSPIKRIEAKPGVITSHRIHRDYDTLDGPFHWEFIAYTDVNRGIHVFLARQAARNYRSKALDNSEKVFKCTADVDDLIGINLGDNQAAFMQIHLTKEEAKRGKKGRNN